MLNSDGQQRLDKAENSGVTLAKSSEFQGNHQNSGGHIAMLVLKPEKFRGGGGTGPPGPPYIQALVSMVTVVEFLNSSDKTQ